MCAWGKDQKVRRNERGLGGPCSRRAALKTLRRSLGGALRIPSLQHPCHLLPLLRRHRPSKLLRTGELRDPVLELPRPKRRRELRVTPVLLPDLLDRCRTEERNVARLAALEALARHERRVDVHGYRPVVVRRPAPVPGARPILPMA